MENGSFTRTEIYSQPEVWEKALHLLQKQRDEIRSFYNQGNFDHILFTGCGSTYYLSLAAAATFMELNHRVARGLPASEAWLYPSTAYPAEGRCLLVAVSRSGSTTETLKACETFAAQKSGDILSISCYPQAPLAGMGKLNLVFPDSGEESIAQTRSFSTMYIAAVALAAVCSGHDDLFESLERLPDIARRLLREQTDMLRSLAQEASLQKFYFLGSGARYGLACEISLKMKEMSLSHSEPFHFMEYRHGPMSMADEHTLLFGMLSHENQPAEMKVLDEMTARRARILAFGEEGAPVSFASNLPAPVRNALYLPLGQVFAFEHALYKGLNPDKPNNLDAVVIL